MHGKEECGALRRQMECRGPGGGGGFEANFTELSGNFRDWVHLDPVMNLLTRAVHVKLTCAKLRACRAHRQAYVRTCLSHEGLSSPDPYSVLSFQCPALPQGYD